MTCCWIIGIYDYEWHRSWSECLKVSWLLIVWKCFHTSIISPLAFLVDDAGMLINFSRCGIQYHADHLLRLLHVFAHFLSCWRVWRGGVPKLLERIPGEDEQTTRIIFGRVTCQEMRSFVLSDPSLHSQSLPLMIYVPRMLVDNPISLRDIFLLIHALALSRWSYISLNGWYCLDNQV